MTFSARRRLNVGFVGSWGKGPVSSSPLSIGQKAVAELQRPPMTLSKVRQVFSKCSNVSVLGAVVVVWRPSGSEVMGSVPPFWAISNSYYLCVPIKGSIRCKYNFRWQHLSQIGCLSQLETWVTFILNSKGYVWDLRCQLQTDGVQSHEKWPSIRARVESWKISIEWDQRVTDTNRTHDILH